MAPLQPPLSIPPNNNPLSPSFPLLAEASDTDSRTFRLANSPRSSADVRGGRRERHCRVMRGAEERRNRSGWRRRTPAKEIRRLPSSLRRRKRLRLLRRQRREASERGDREDLLLLHRRAHHPLGGRGPPPSLPILITPKKTPPHQERPGTLVPMYLRQRGVRGVPTYNKL